MTFTKSRKLVPKHSYRIHKQIFLKIRAYKYNETNHKLKNFKKKKKQLNNYKNMWVGVKMTQRQSDTVRHFGTEGYFGMESHLNTQRKNDTVFY